MGSLLPLEFSDCLLDSPYFRENLKAHEKQLDMTFCEIKVITKEIQDVLDAAKTLSKCKRSLANSLKNFQFNYMTTSLTDDELTMANSFKEFSDFFNIIEDEMDRILEKSYEKFIAPLIRYRKEQIGQVRERKKTFDKVTSKFVNAQDRYMNLNWKKESTGVSEAENLLLSEHRNLKQTSLEYIYHMHLVQERKKFEFVEAILSFCHIWSNYYKNGALVAGDFDTYMQDLKIRVQTNREHFATTAKYYELYKNKILDEETDPGSTNPMYARQGYLFVHQQNHLRLGSHWMKLYCQFKAEDKTLIIMPYNQGQPGKIMNGESICVTFCQCKDGPNDKFKFLVTGIDSNQQVVTKTFSTISEWDRKRWIEAMGGTWPVVSNLLQKLHTNSLEDSMNCNALRFLINCFNQLEHRGLGEQQGLYRVSGVISKVKQLFKLTIETNEPDICLDNALQWESKTIASAIKQYFRDLVKPVMTYRLYGDFVEAAQQESEIKRIEKIHSVVRRLPINNHHVLGFLVRHLHKVSTFSGKNFMNAGNLGVCFGPTLLRPKKETVATIMDIKFCNKVVEIMILHAEEMFPLRKTAEVTPKCYRILKDKPVKCELKKSHSFNCHSSTKSLLNSTSFSAISSKCEEPSDKYNHSKSNQNCFDSSQSILSCSSSAHDDKLMASLEILNSLAADLPGMCAESFNRDTSTRQNHRRRSETHIMVNKPPRPKLSLNTGDSSTFKSMGKPCISAEPAPFLCGPITSLTNNYEFNDRIRNSAMCLSLASIDTSIPSKRSLKLNRQIHDSLSTDALNTGSCHQQDNFTSSLSIDSGVITTPDKQRKLITIPKSVDQCQETQNEDWIDPTTTVSTNISVLTPLKPISSFISQDEIPHHIEHSQLSRTCDTKNLSQKLKNDENCTESFTTYTRVHIPNVIIQASTPS